MKARELAEKLMETPEVEVTILGMSEITVNVSNGDINFSISSGRPYNFATHGEIERRRPDAVDSFYDQVGASGHGIVTDCPDECKPDTVITNGD